MAAREVTAPDGRRWRVRRRWLPHREGIGWRARISRRRIARRAKRLADGADIADGCVPFDIDAVVLVLAVIAAVVFLVLFGWPLLLLLLDFVWLVVVLLAGVAAKVLFRRPWRVEAVDGAGERLEWNVVGYRSAGVKRDDVVAALAAGRPAPA